MNKIFALLLCLTIMPAFAAGDYVEYIDQDPSPSLENMALLENQNAPKYTDDTGIAWREFASGYYELDESSKNHASGLNPGDWRAFNADTEILGAATCNEHDINTNTLFAAGAKTGKNCWCKIIATTNDVNKSIPSKWVYRGQYNDATECANLCTYRCSYNFLDDPDFRAEILNK